MIKRFITSGYFGAGVGIGLYAANFDLPTPSYLVQIPFWILVASPLGSFWNKVGNYSCRKYYKK